MKRSVFISTAVAAVAAATLALTGCSGAASGEATSSDASARIHVVASTDVWGDIAKQIGGTDVEVTSIIDSPAKDPHEYQPSGQNQLAVSKADVVVVNGGGYDAFVDDMLASLSRAPVVLNVADISGYDQHTATGEFNEHLWYDFPTVQKVASKLERTFAKARPAQAAAFEKNEQTFRASLASLSDSEARLKSQYAGAGVAITEPVPLYVLSAIGLVNKTPEKLSAAIENDTDVAPSVLQDALAIFSRHDVDLLVYNEQTTGAQTTKLLDAAKENGVPAVPVTETLPSGKNYLDWMRDNLDRIGAALGRAAA